MADFPPKKGVAYTYDFPVRDADGKHVTGASVTSTVSKDGGAFAPCANAAAEIGTTGVWSHTLSIAEMTCDRFAVKHVVTGQANVDIYGETVVRQLADIPTATENATAVGALAIDGTVTLKQVLEIITAALAGKLSGAATTTITIRDVNDTRNCIVATVDADGNRSAVTLNVV